MKSSRSVRLIQNAGPTRGAGAAMASEDFKDNASTSGLFGVTEIRAQIREPTMPGRSALDALDPRERLHGARCGRKRP